MSTATNPNNTIMENQQQTSTDDNCSIPPAEPRLPPPASAQADPAAYLSTAIVDKVNQLNLRADAGAVVVNATSESFSALMSAYDSDLDESETDTAKWKQRDDRSSSEFSSSASDNEEILSDDSEACAVGRGAIKKTNFAPRSKGELDLDELPPVPDLTQLTLAAANEKFVLMGNVYTIVDRLVTVAALPNSPAYDLDTLLYLDGGRKALGFVFDVFGQVASPIYTVRFNTVEKIKQLGLEVGTKVYSAPTGKHTQYVFLQELLRLKGSDASWKGDNEVPCEFADYSDDESECHKKHGNRRLQANYKRTHSMDQHQDFVNTMNKRNLLKTKLHRVVDSYKQLRTLQAGQVPEFDPTVPPPNFQMPSSSTPQEQLNFSQLFNKNL